MELVSATQVLVRCCRAEQIATGTAIASTQVIVLDKVVGTSAKSELRLPKQVFVHVPGVVRMRQRVESKPQLMRKMVIALVVSSPHSGLFFANFHAN